MRLKYDILKESESVGQLLLNWFLIYKINQFLKEHKLYFSEQSTGFDINGNINSYNHINKTISYINNKISKDFTDINKHVQSAEQTTFFILTHEMGHAVQHQSTLQVNNGNNYRAKPVIFFNKGVTEEIPQLDNLFSTFHQPKSVNLFLYGNMHEAYADQYALLASYIKYKDINLFDKIYNYRVHEYNKIKSNNPEDVSSYHHFEVIKMLKQQIQNNQISLTKPVNYLDLHHIIIGNSIKSLTSFVIDECKNNPAFLNDFNTYVGKDIQGFFSTILDNLRHYDVFSQSDINTINKDALIISQTPIDTSKHINECKLDLINNLSDNQLSKSLTKLLNIRKIELSNNLKSQQPSL